MSKEAAVNFLAEMNAAGLRITTREQIAAERTQAFQEFEQAYRELMADPERCPQCARSKETDETVCARCQDD